MVEAVLISVVFSVVASLLTVLLKKVWGLFFGLSVAEIIRVQISFLNTETPLGKIMVEYFSK